MKKNIFILFLLLSFTTYGQLYQNVSDLIDGNLPNNNTQHITAARLRAVFDLAVQDVGASQIYGPVSVDYDPGTPQNPVAYLTTPGTYDNFLDSGDSPCEISTPLGILKWDGADWTVYEIDIDVNVASNVYFTDTTICVIGIDTTCTELDSFYLEDANTVCFIVDGDTTCFESTLSGMVPINTLLAATAANTIDNGNYTQTWNWTSLAGTGLSLNSVSGSGTRKLLSSDMSGGVSGGSLSTAGYFNVANTGGNTNTGVLGYATGASTNYGVSGQALSGYGVFGHATSGVGMWAFADSGLPFRAEDYTVGTNTVEVISDYKRGTDGTPGIGLGGAITFTNMATGPNYVESNRLTSKWVKATYPPSSQFIIQGIKLASTGVYATFSGDSITLDTTSFHIDVINDYVGINNKTPARALDVLGLMNLNQTASLNNVFINGGLSTASGGGNIAIGSSTTLDAITSGADNIAIGSIGVSSMTTGSRNLGIGSSTMTFLNDETDNIGIGYGAWSASGGDSTICIGTATGGGTDLDASVIVGYGAGTASVGGGWKKNVCLGANAGHGALGSSNVMIGYRAGYGQAASNRLVIENTGSATPLIDGNFSDDSVRINGTLAVKNRFKESQGADVASVTGTITLGEGNSFEITGTNSIDRILGTGWTNGNTITLWFTSTATLVDGTANSTIEIGMDLAGNGNFGATADDNIVLQLCEIGGVQRWREVSRSAN